MKTNQTIELLLERSSCRSFKADPIPEPIMEQILLAGVHAPTGGNLQPYSVIRIEDQLVKDRLTELCGGQKFISQAPVNLLFCLDLWRNKQWAKLEQAPYTADNSFRHFWISFQDTIICAQNMCTAIDAVGLGSVYVGTVLECFDELREMFALPLGVFPVVLLSLGYPKQEREPAPKLGIDVVVHKERYHKPADQDLQAAMAEKYRGRSFPVTDERLAAFKLVCQKVHGQEFAEQAEAQARQRGEFSVAQRYFGMHYTADTMASGNLARIKQMEAAGLKFFRGYKPDGEGN